MSHWKQIIVTALIVVISGIAGFMLGWNMKPSFEWKTLDIQYEEGNLFIGFIPAPYVDTEKTSVRIVLCSITGDVIRDEPAAYYDGVYGCAFSIEDFGGAKISAVLYNEEGETKIPLAESVTVMQGVLQEYKPLYRRQQTE